MTEGEIKKHLYENDPQFRRFKEKHQKYKEELGKIEALAFLTPEQKVEQKSTKKKKLHLKDQMQEMISAFKLEQAEK